MAAVLWTAAKFSVPRDHKLALPRRLKTLLLDMARRHASERPSAAEAIKVTIHYGQAYSKVSGVRLGDSGEFMASACDAEADKQLSPECLSPV